MLLTVGILVVSYLRKTKKSNKKKIDEIFSKKMNSLKKGEVVQLANFEGNPSVPLLNFERSPEVPFLNFREVPVPTFKL